MITNGCWLVCGGITVSKNANLMLKSEMSFVWGLFQAFGQSLHMAGASDIWIDQVGFRSWEKLHCSDVNATFLIRDGTEYSGTISDCKKWKLWNILFLQVFNFAPKISGSPSSRNSLVNRECRQELFSVVSRQIKHRTLEFSIRRGQQSFIKALSVSC